MSLKPSIKEWKKNLVKKINDYEFAEKELTEFAKAFAKHIDKLNVKKGEWLIHHIVFKVEKNTITMDRLSITEYNCND